MARNNLLARALAVGCLGGFPKRLFEDDAIQAADVALGDDSLFVRCESAYVLDAHIVGFHFQVLAVAVIARGAVVQQQQLGLAKGQRVALDVVGVVVPLQAQLFPQARLVLRRERLESLPFIPQGVEGLKLVMHGAGKPEMETRATGKR